MRMVVAALVHQQGEDEEEAEISSKKDFKNHSEWYVM